MRSGEVELKAVYDSHKSFWGKATIKERIGGELVLTSYETEVAGIYKGEPWCNGWYSPTTARHIRDFMLQFANGSHFDTSIKALRAKNRTRDVVKKEMDSVTKKV